MANEEDPHALINRWYGRPDDYRGGSTYGFNPTTLANPGAWAPWASGQAGYNTAAKGAERAAQQNRAFADTQWGRAMEGMKGAQGAYAPSQAAWQQYYGNAGADRGPGAMEEWWANNSGKFNDPTATSSALSQWQQQMFSPMQATGAYNQYQQYMQQPSSTQGAYTYMQGQLSQPMQGQGAYDRMRQATAKPGVGENWFASNEGAYRNPTNSQTLYNNSMGALGNAGRSEGFQVQTGNQEDYRAKTDSLFGQQQGPGYLDQNAGEIGSRFRGADDVTAFAGRNLGALEQDGTFEQWAKSAIEGSNPMQDRIRERGLAQLNQEMARRGHFNSGGAGTAIGNYLAEQNAQEFAQKSDLAKGAQEMQLARLGQGQGLAEGSAANKFGIGSSLQGLYAQQDSTKLGRDSLAAQIARDQSEQDLATQALTMQSHQNADAAKLARLQGLSGMAGQADSTSLNLLNAGQDAAFRSQDAGRQRTLDDFASATRLDENQLSRLMAQMAGAGQNDRTNMDRFQTQYDMGRGLDQEIMARYGMLGDLSGQQDAASLARLMGGGQMAGSAQDAWQRRNDSSWDERNDAFGARFGLDDAVAGTWKDFYGMGMDASGTAMNNSINAGANAAQLRGQGQIASSPGKLAEAGAEVYGAYSTGGASGLARGQTLAEPSYAESRTYAPPSAYASAPGGAAYDTMSLEQMLANAGDNGGSGRTPEEGARLRRWYLESQGLSVPPDVLALSQRYRG